MSLAFIRPLIDNALVRHTINLFGGGFSYAALIGAISPTIGLLTGLVLLGYYTLLFYERPTVQDWLARRRAKKAAGKQSS